MGLVEYEEALRPKPGLSADEAVQRLRELTLKQPLEEDSRRSTSQCSLRGRVWKALLRVPAYDHRSYTCLLNEPDQELRLSTAIKGDVSRTFQAFVKFKQNVSQQEHGRVVSALGNKPSSEWSYKAVMSPVAGILLYNMPEADAFFTQMRLMRCHFPAYISEYPVGWFRAYELIDKIIAHVDPDMFVLLKDAQGKCLSSVQYASTVVNSFSLSRKPFPAVLRLWDFFIAYGFHLNVITTAVQFMEQKTQVEELAISGKGVHSAFQSLPDLDAEFVIGRTIEILKTLPSDMYKDVMDHALNMEPMTANFHG